MSVMMAENFAIYRQKPKTEHTQEGRPERRSFCWVNRKEEAHERKMVESCRDKSIKDGVSNGDSIDRYRCGFVRRELAGCCVRVNPCGDPVAADFSRWSS